MPAISNPWRNIAVHRIGVYTEHGLSPGLVERFMQAAQSVGCRNVVDPFVGSGVVAIEAQKKCFLFLGIDADPWSLILVAAKTRPLNYNELMNWLTERLSSINELEPLVPSYRLRRYHTQLVLSALGRLRRLVEEADPAWKPLLLTVLGKVASEYSLFRRSPAPRFRKELVEAPEHFIYERYLRLLNSAIKDLTHHQFCGRVDLVWSDSTTWLPRRICGLLTSPPFANNLDYVRHTMLELLWSSLARNSEDLGWLRSIQVPACEAAARAWKREAQHAWLRELAEKIKGSRARGYRRFLLQYFYSMDKHFELLSERLEWEAWYTVGDSILGGTYIPVHEALAKLAKSHGLEAEIRPLGERFRPGRKLYLLILRSRK